MRFYLFVQRAPLYNPLSPLYTHRPARSSWSGYIATRYVASSSYILIRSPRSLNLCTLSPTVSFLFFVLESRATLSFLPSRHEIQPWVLGTYITLTELPLPPLSLSFLSELRIADFSAWNYVLILRAFVKNTRREVFMIADHILCQVSWLINVLLNIWQFLYMFWFFITNVCNKFS